MEKMEFVSTKFHLMESNLISMFRLCQRLYALTKDERKLLVDGKAVELDDLAKQKVKVFESIEKVEQEYQKIFSEIKQISGLSPEIDSLSELLKHFQEYDVQQIRRMQEGILTLQKDIKEVNTGNYALAKLNLQHLEAVQGFIVNSVYPSSSYYGPENQAPQELPTNWQMDQKA